MARLGEIGDTGLSQSSGIIQEDFLTELRGTQGYRRYREMLLNSPIVGAMLTAVELSIRNVRWQYTSDAGEDDERVTFLHEVRDNMSHSWNDHVIEILSMIPYGYSYFEIVYQRDERGRLAWRKFAIRGQDTLMRWDLDERGGINGFVQQAPPSYRLTLIPIDKAILYRTRVERNNPEGRSMLRTAWIPYYYLKNIQQTEAIGIERDLAGMPVIKLPSGATTGTDSTSDASKAAKTVRNLRRDEQDGVVLPDGWELELLSTGGTRQFDTNAIIQRYESRILMSMLAQFLVLGQKSVVTQALSSDQTDFWNTIVNAICDIIAETHTKFAARRLLDLNGFDPDGISLTHTPAGDPDLPGMADFLQRVGTYLTWTPQDEAWLRGLAKLPELDPEEIEQAREDKMQQAIEMAQATRPAVSEAPARGGSASSDRGGPPSSARPDQNAEPISAAMLGELLTEIRRANYLVEHL